MGGPDALPRRLGAYELVEQLGAGATGVTYRARHVELSRDVAVKVLSPTLTGNARVLERFRREARALAGLTHANIVAIHDFGQQGSQVYMVLELVEGGTLREAMDRDGPSPVEQALRVGREVLAGLAYVHEHGILHRDVKPENLLLTRDGVVKLADFGLAKAEAFTGITQAGATLGTPTYMAPEQCGLPGWPTEVDARADLFALGALLFELLTGRLPWGGTSLTELHAAKLEPPPDPRRLAPGVPEHLALTIMRLLAPRAADRFPDARAAAASLDAPPAERTTSTRRVSASGRLAPVGRPTRIVLRAATASHEATLQLGRRVSLGRSSQRADIVIPEQRLSRLHAELWLEPDGSVWVRDLGSSNGTIVNGRPAAPAGTRLSAGDRIRLGDTTLDVELPADEDTLPPAGLACGRCGRPVRPGSIVEGRAAVMSQEVVCSRCALDTPLENRLKAEGFRVEERLDRGGVAHVYRARRTSLDELVALQVLDLDDPVATPELVARFRRDARALARLKHSAAARVIDVREGNRLVCVASEFVEGERLSDRLNRRGPLQLPEALQVMYNIMRVAELAEGQGLYHRNLTPRSVIISAGGEPRLVAFELAALADPDLERLDDLRLRFMAPERLWRTPGLSPATADCWSMGALLAYCVSGHLPLRDLGPEGLRAAVRGRTLQQPAPEVAGRPQLTGLLRRMLDLDPSRRPQTIRELLAGFEEAVRADVLPGFKGSIAALLQLVSAGELDHTSTARFSGPRGRTRGVIGGTFEGDELVEFVQMIGLNQRTGTLSVVAEGVEGVVHLDQGALVGAKLGAQSGLPAARTLVRQREGAFEFTPEASLPHQFAPVQIPSFLLDLLRESDEAGRSQAT